ncbi:tRNA lysidine(34) synthetase TilS [Aliidiomarina sedimenti]|uniref:tRNA(Ile)-lysidine synthase n=1 Tax=Aliidiomarina sedimenti TaxID=1933879 RepID=A0ABY0BXD2_9GAMM|nr:tRNA lysidine(34) synthetase TilS [Aliidiomarina sedimenti]RUO28816.1 tRNA lysidine(34) synthetase TilS [Aliidiomarina sedimenti]
MATVKSISDQFYQSYCAALDSLQLQGPSSIVVALGGGADSQSVLDLTLRYRQQHPQHHYLAIHLDHYFHPDSPQWAQFLREYCQRSSIDYIVEPLDVPLSNRQSKEAQGRDARYQRLTELTDDNAVILLGQHLSDQTETFLLQLKRGSGPKGLASMAAVAPFSGQRRLCRPLLGHSKNEIYQYAKARQLQWVEDDTNLDTRIDRNFLRHEIVPELRARWPQFEQTVARSARLCGEQQALLESLLESDLQLRLDQNGLDSSGFDKLSPVHQAALLRLFIQRQGAAMPSEAVLSQMLQQMQGSKVEVRWSQWQLRSHRDRVQVLPLFADLSQFSLAWDGEETLQLPDGLGELTASGTQEVMVDADASLQVRLLRHSDSFQRRPGGTLHKAHRLLKKQGIAQWQRQRWPVVTDGHQLLWVPLLGINHQIECAQRARRHIYPNWVRASVAGVTN